MAKNDNFQKEFEANLNKIRNTTYTKKDLEKLAKDWVKEDKPKTKAKKEVKECEEKPNKFLEFIERQLESIRRVLG